jgi:glycosyltransferase involved in cell wall biosynthesis
VSSKAKGKGTIINHPQPVVSIIIPVMNEKRTLAKVLQQASKVHRCSEVIVIDNGSTDGTSKIAASWGARLISFEAPLGHDVGRRVGAEMAKGEVLLFIDGDIVIPALHLKHFVQAILSGVDVALNGYRGPIEREPVHPVILAKHVLNASLGRADLEGASMTAIPHAISRRALQVIGSKALEIPPLAMTIAIYKGLHVKAVHTVAVGRKNPTRFKPRNTETVDPLSSLIVGDHLEALHWIHNQRGSRGGYEDLGRKRDQVKI